MLHVRKILFPTDFSASSNRAFVYAVALARRFKAELHLLHVVVLYGEDPYNPARYFPDLDAARNQLREEAATRMEETLIDSDVDALTVRKVSRRGISPGPVIIDYAREEDIDLVVLATHGRRGMRHLLMGSITEEVVRLAPCPVLSVRRDGEAIGRVERILVPIDFSKHSKAALAVARKIAAVYGAELQLLHVVEEMLHPAFYNMGAKTVKDLQPDIVKRSERALDALAQASVLDDAPDDAPAGGAGVRSSVYVVEGHAGRDITRFAEHHDSDLIVIATHGLSGLEQLLMGGVAEKVIRRAACPVLVLKAFDAPAGPTDA